MAVKPIFFNSEMTKAIIDGTKMRSIVFRGEDKDDGRWYTGDALLDIRTYTPFDPANKGIKRVTLDITAGRKSSRSSEKSKTAPSSRWSSTLLLRWIGPVYHLPDGTSANLSFAIGVRPKAFTTIVAYCARVMVASG